MVIETKSIVKKCDCCGKVIPERSAFLNDGSFQSNSLDIGDVNVCVQCCGEIMITFMSDDLSEEQLKKWADDRSLGGGHSAPAMLMKNLFYGAPVDSVKTHFSDRDKQDGSILNTPIIT